MTRDINKWEDDMNISQEQLLQYAREYLSYAILFVVVAIFYQVLKRGLKTLAEREYLASTAHVFVKNIAKWSLILFFVVVVLQGLGLKISSILAGLLTVAGMVAIGFIAVWSILSNILCSFLLMTFRMFEIGDDVEILEPGSMVTLKGKVAGFNVMYTSLSHEGQENGDGVITQVPNNIFFQKSLRRKPADKPESLSQHILKKPLNFLEKNKT